MIRQVCAMVCLFWAMPAIAFSQIVISNKNFSFGTTGRIGFGYSPNVEGHTGRQLNLLGQGSLGGRLEQGDYVDFLPAFHFTPVNTHKDSTDITFQARLAFYSSNGTFLGNVNSGSINGVVVSLPEAFVEAKNIAASQWSLWAGARYMRYDDIHISDYFYFDDHSTQGFGIKYRNTSFSMFFPAAIDTSSASVTPYSYANILSGTKSLAYRQREIMVAEHSILHKNTHTIKLLAEYHYIGGVKENANPSYPSDRGFVAGIKLSTNLKTRKTGSFNQISVRYGNGIANGGNNSNTQTWQTYGAPDEQTRRYNSAYSLTATEHFLLNFSDKFSLNGYAVFTKTKGGSDARDKAKDYYNREVSNRKQDIAVGGRGIFYLSNALHLITELHHTRRTDGSGQAAAMTKLVFAPTVVPTAERSPWARPHIRFICALAHYNKQAVQTQASSFLQQAGHKTWGTYFGVRSEWWIF